MSVRRDPTRAPFRGVGAGSLALAATCLLVGSICAACSASSAVGAAPDGSAGNGATDDAGAGDGGFELPDGHPPIADIPKLVFVTKAVYGAALGGANGADEACRLAALAAGLPGAKSPGSYRAWIGERGSDTPATRFDPSEAYLYTRTDGVLVARGWTELTTEALLAPLVKTEDGADVAGGAACGPDGGLAVWTGAWADGSLVSEADGTCGTWFSAAATSKGAAGSTALVAPATPAPARTAGWSVACTLACDAAAHLYCFQD